MDAEREIHVIYSETGKCPPGCFVRRGRAAGRERRPGGRPSGPRVGRVQVFVGYADTARANPANFPTPWEGSPGVIYEGCSPSSGCVFDSGAARVVNNTGSPVTVNSVILHFSAGCTYDIGPTMSPCPLAASSLSPRPPAARTTAAARATA